MARTAGGGVQSAGAQAAPESAGRRLKVHTAVATVLLLASSVGLMTATRTTAAGPSVAAVVFGLLFVIAILYYVEVRVMSSRHRRERAPDRVLNGTAHGCAFASTAG